MISPSILSFWMDSLALQACLCQSPCLWWKVCISCSSAFWSSSVSSSACSSLPFLSQNALRCSITIIWLLSSMPSSLMLSLPTTGNPLCRVYLRRWRSLSTLSISRTLATVWDMICSAFITCSCFEGSDLRKDTVPFFSRSDSYTPSLWMLCATQLDMTTARMTWKM